MDGLSWKFYFHLASVFLQISIWLGESGNLNGVANRLGDLARNNKKNWVQGPKSFLEARLLIFSSKLVTKDICSESN